MSLARLVSWSLLSSSLLLGACVQAPDLGHDGLEGKVGSGDDGCPAWGCTGNSPTMGPFDFHELDLDGSDNKEGVSISRIELGGVPVRAGFRDGNRLVAEDTQGNSYQGAQLDGLVFTLRTPSGDYLLTINHVTPQASSPTKLWLGTQARVETYELVYADALMPLRTHPVCANPPGHELDPLGATAWSNIFEAVLFTGDRYDASEKTVTAASYGDAGNWFNIGCAGSALAKLHLSLSTTSSSDPAHQTGLAERQAKLKMFAGDFCGKGWAFTLPGTPLAWADRQGWATFSGTEIGFESFWNEDGAICVTEHRLGPTALSNVLAACQIPACPGNPFPSTWAPGAYLKTAIPAP